MLSDRQSVMRSMYSGGTVRSWSELSSFRADAEDAIIDHARREAFRLNRAQLRANYDGGVEFQLRDSVVLLCPQTVDFLYTRFTPTMVRYERGSRPRIEEVVESCIGGLSGDVEKMLALMRFCRDLRKRKPPTDIRQPDRIFGGTEEQLIDKGEDLCECLSRLFVALCQVAGIPGRIVHHVIGGHIVAEAFAENGWAYVDPTAGVYFRGTDGRLASTWDIWVKPEIIRQQTDLVKVDVSDRWTWEERARQCESMFFDLRELTGMVNHSLADSSVCNYSQVTGAEAAELGLWKIHARYDAARHMVFGLQES